MPDDFKSRLKAWARVSLKSMREMPVPDLRLPATPPQGTGEKEVAVLHVSDVQYGKVTSTYNSKVAEERLMLLAEKVGQVVKVHRAGARVDRLHLYIGGDIVEGEAIFRGQTFSIDQPVYDQAIHGASTALARFILALLRYFDEIHVVCVPGNHGKNGYEGSPSNWDNVCCEMLKHKLLGGQELFPERRKLARRLTFAPIGEWFHVDRIFGWGNLIVHGDQIEGTVGGSGFKSKVAGWMDSIPQPWDYLWLGHFHTLSSWIIYNRTVNVNGTTESDNKYAQEKFAAIGSPVQRLAFFNRKHGLVADHRIYLNDREAK